MSFIESQTAYFRTLAENHVDLLHTANKPAFVRLTEEEMEAGVMNKMGKTVLALAGISGFYTHNSDYPERNLQTVLHVYCKPEGATATQKNAALFKAFQVMEDIVARMFADAAEEVPGCPALLDVGHVSFNETAEVLNGYIGWTATIQHVPNTNPLRLNSSRWNDL